MKKNLEYIQKFLTDIIKIKAEILRDYRTKFSRNTHSSFYLREYLIYEPETRYSSQGGLNKYSWIISMEDIPPKLVNDSEKRWKIYLQNLKKIQATIADKTVNMLNDLTLSEEYLKNNKYDLGIPAYVECIKSRSDLKSLLKEAYKKVQGGYGKKDKTKLTKRKKNNLENDIQKGLDNNKPYKEVISDLAEKYGMSEGRLRHSYPRKAFK